MLARSDRFRLVCWIQPICKSNRGGFSLRRSIRVRHYQAEEVREYSDGRKPDRSEGIVRLLCANATGSSATCCGASVRSVILIVGGAFIALSSRPLQSQVAGTNSLAFLTASVKASDVSPAPTRMGLYRDGRFTATNITLRDLIRVAYGYRNLQLPSQVIGASGWVESDRFDIIAKGDFSSAPDGPPERLTLMLRRLLDDRFKVKIHTARQERPIYSLLLTSTDGTLGPQLSRSQGSCTGAAGSVAGELFSLSTRQCGIRVSPGLLSGQGMTIARLATTLAHVCTAWR